MTRIERIRTHRRLAVAAGLFFWAAQAGAQDGRWLDSDFSSQPYPYASAVDFGGAPIPTGAHGFVRKAADGTLRFEDGARARFFGVNIAKDALFVDDAAMDRMVEVIRAAGLNLVRLHHFDGPDGILSGKRDVLDLFTAERLDRLDRWIAKLGKVGVYVYIDLLDYRVFDAADGIQGGERLGRGAKPYVVLSPELQYLAKEYAAKLLRDHVNPYTGLRYVEDPTIAFVEIYDENGLFIRRGDIPTLRAPFRQDFGRLWNAWLKREHQTTARLREAWTDPNTGQCPLLERESLEQGNLDLPRLVLRPPNEPMSNTGLDGAARMNDAVRFLSELQAAFLSDMHRHLRSIGVKVPIGAVGSLDHPPDHAVMARTLDFIGTNFYWDHPAWEPGRDWQPPYWFANRSPLSDAGPHSLGPAVAAARTAGTPLVVREWSYCWPNEFRAAGAVELAAFCAHQGIDCVLAFTYGSGAQPVVGLFDLRSDPVRWGVLAHAAALYLRGGLDEARTRVEIAHSDTDLYSYFDYGTPLLALSYVSRLERRYGPAGPTPPTLTVSSGRSANLSVTGRGRLLWNEVRRQDLRGTLSADGVTERSGYSLPRAIPEDPVAVAWDGRVGDSGETATVSGRRLYVVEDLRERRLDPIGATRDGSLAVGFADASSETWAFGNIGPATATRAALDLLGRLGATGASHDCLDTGRFVSDTGQIVRDAGREVVTVEGRSAAAVAGTGRTGGALTAGPLSVESGDAQIAAFAVSLDGEPLASARRVSIKYVSTAGNTGQTLRREEGGPKPFLLAFNGQAPPTTGVRVSPRPVLVRWNGRPLARVFATGAAFELILTEGSLVLVGELPGVRAAGSEGAGAVLPDRFGAFRIEGALP